MPFLQTISEKYKFTVSQTKILTDIEHDLNMWNEKTLESIWPYELEEKYQHKELTKQILKYIQNYWDNLKNNPNDYSKFKDIKYDNSRKFSFTQIEKEGLGLGACPVASESTRCCNLLTLDAVESCGFDCSYCSIQSFYNENKIGFDKNFKEKLKNLNLDPEEIYHIGTGQSSDSLMWGNREGILDALFEFALKHQNVILEFKTKSDNISYFLENEVPSNIIVTWSLNTPTIIENEEHLTATLDKRIESARKLADKGVLVGFHFHPIVHYENYLNEYEKVYKTLLDKFKPHEVVLVSLGTLTFIKPVIKKLRTRELKSKILQMPFCDASGKTSYPLEIKKEMFKHAYDIFAPWHGKVYFYLCMEDHSLWKEVFGYEYASNHVFEDMMKISYMQKIRKNF